eukprot:s6575_g3.t2
MALIPKGLSVRPVLCDPVPLGLPQRSRTSAAQRSRPKQAWAISSAASLFAWQGLRCRKDRLPRASTTSTIQIEPATDADVRPAAEVAVRSLRWTKGWLDEPKFKDEDYALLAGREVQAYRKLYLTATPSPSTLLVARLRRTETPKKEANSWFDFGGSGSASSKVVGCVGCEVKCFNIFTNEELPIFRSDGGRETVLRPVMADLAVSSECQGRGIGRQLVEKLEEVVFEEWGYDELVLLVEATNFQARGVYERLGYRLAGIRLGQVTTYLDASEPRDSTSRVKERTTVAFLLRKSLKPFPWGNLENQNWGLLLALLGGAAYLQSSELGEELLGLQGPELFRYLSDLGLTFPSFPEHLKERTELSVTGCDKDEQKPFGVVFALCSALAAEVLRAFRLMELEVVTELRISRAQSSGAEVDNGGLLPDNRREVSFRLFVPVDESGLDSTAASLTLQAKDREVAMSYPVKDRLDSARYGMDGLHGDLLLGCHSTEAGMPTTQFKHILQPRAFVILCSRNMRIESLPCPRSLHAAIAGKLLCIHRAAMGNSQGPGLFGGPKCCLGLGGSTDMQSMVCGRSNEYDLSVQAEAVGSPTCCLAWRLGVDTAFAIKVDQLQKLHEQIVSHLAYFEAHMLVDDATSGLIMGSGVEGASMNAPDAMTRMGQLLCRWALSQSPSIGLLVGVDYGILYSVNGLLSMQNSSDSRAFFGPVCAGARQLADASRQEGMVHLSLEAKQQLSALRFIPLILGSQNRFYLDAFTEVTDPNEQKGEECFLQLRGNTLQRFVELVRVHLRFRNNEGRLQELRIKTEMTDAGTERERNQLLAMVMRLKDQGSWKQALERCFEQKFSISADAQGSLFHVAKDDGAVEETMVEEEVLACQFASWFPTFRDVTFKSEILPLSEDFVKYLLADGIHVPVSKPQESDGASDGSWGSGGDSANEAQDLEGVFDFPELEDSVRSAISRLNGQVLPKLNWSAPKDAHWIHGSLKCTTPAEVFTLLKASDFVSHDLCHAFDHCGPSARRRPDDFTLVLRRWHSLHDSSEFRAFVKDTDLLAISQRQTGCFFEHLMNKEEVEAIQAAIQEFFEQKMQERFRLKRYVFDVYVDIPPRRRVWLVDLSPWGPTTDACLFDWDDLAEMSAASAPELRVVQSEAERRGRLENFHQIPLELAELSSKEGLSELIEKADKILAQKEEQS